MRQDTRGVSHTQHNYSAFTLMGAGNYGPKHIRNVISGPGTALEHRIGAATPSCSKGSRHDPGPGQRTTSEADHLMTQQTSEAPVGDPAEGTASDAPRLPLLRLDRARDRTALAGPLGGRGRVQCSQPDRSARGPGVPRRCRRRSYSTSPRNRPVQGCTSVIRSGTSGRMCSRGIQRMPGHNILHTIGSDSFGLPAEQFAVQTGTTRG